jgi:hypothetical protein
MRLLRRGQSPGLPFAGLLRRADDNGKFFFSLLQQAALEKQAAAYRKLAEDRAKKIGVPPPEKPSK